MKQYDPISRTVEEIEPTVTISLSRHEELIKKEEYLNRMKKALRCLSFYNSDFELFKKLFGLNEVEE